jgi:hypothetical protein
LPAEQAHEPAVADGSAACAPDDRGQALIVGNNQETGGFLGKVAFGQANDQFVRGRAAGVADLDAGGDAPRHQSVFGGAVQDQNHGHAGRDDCPKPPDESRRRQGIRGPTQGVQDIGSVDDEALDTFEDL